MSSIGSIDDEVPQNSFGAVPIKNSQKRRKCPLCKQNLCLYNLNYEEMVLMCENEDCDYPFGFEALQIVANECELRDNPEPATEEFFMYPTGESIQCTMDTVSTTSLFLSSSLMSELDPQNLETDFPVAEDNIYDDTYSVHQRKSRMKKKARNRQIEKNLDSIKRLNTEMSSLSDHFDTNITSRKWLNKLKMWEASSGKTLLKEEEVVILEKNKPPEDEVKISFNSGARLPTVNIEIFKNK